MLKILKAHDRGHTQLNWLDSWHSFSFGGYRNPDYMGFHTLRVINDDKVKPAMGFSMHQHYDMEIISYVLNGSLAHKDSLGNGSTIVAGDVQRMSAGAGILHSEFNPDSNEIVHFLQIWILPREKGINPGYEQKNFSTQRKAGQLTLLASNDGRDNSLTIHQDADMYVLDLNPEQTFNYVVPDATAIWIQMARGEASINEIFMHQGDGLAIENEKLINITAKEKSELLIFELKLN